MKPHLIFSTYDSLGNPYYSGGGAHAVHEVAKRLSSRYRVTVVAGRYPGSSDAVRDCVHYVYVGTSIAPVLDQIGFHLALLTYARSHPWDVWVESFTPPAVMGLLPRLVHRPVIGLAHMLPAEDMERKYNLPVSRIERSGLRQYRHVIATSPYFARLIKSISPSTIVAQLSNGIDRLSLVRGHKNALIYLGRIEIDQKGLDLLISAYKVAGDKARAYPLLLAGSGRQSEVQRLIQLIGSDPQIKYLGRVEGVKKAALYSRALAVIAPSRFETFGLVAAEALAHRIPLITLDIPGLSWIPKSARWVARKPTTQSLANTLNKFVDNPSIAKQKSSKAYRLVASLTWDNSAKHYDHLIREVLHAQV